MKTAAELRAITDAARVKPLQNECALLCQQLEQAASTGASELIFPVRHVLSVDDLKHFVDAGFTVVSAEDPIPGRGRRHFKISW